MTFRRRKPEPKPEPKPAGAWRLDEVAVDIYQRRGKSMNQVDIRSTDAFAPLRVVTNAAEAREAALSSVTVTCLDCFPPQTFVGNTIPDHPCKDRKGNDNRPMQKARAAGARRQLRALSQFPIPDCVICGVSMKPGMSHLCRSSAKLMPHDQVVADLAAKASRDALLAELEEIQGGRR